MSIPKPTIEWLDPAIKQCCPTMRGAVQSNTMHIREYGDDKSLESENIKIKLYFLTSVGEIKFCPWCGSGVLQ